MKKALIPLIIGLISIPIIISNNFNNKPSENKNITEAIEEIDNTVGNLSLRINQLQQENQLLKQKYEMQKDSNKLLCKAITCDDCDCKVCEAHKENIKYKSVLDEIREYINEHSIYFATKEKVGNYFANCSCDELLQILDKVK